MTRTPDAGVTKFEHRAGSEEVPILGGMSRLGDEAQIPLRQHHLLVNVRFSPGELGSRPGLTEDSSIGFAACVTGLIETEENTGSGGVVSGLLTGYAFGSGPFIGEESWYYLNPQDDQEPPDESEARALVTQGPFGSGLTVPESHHPLCGVRSHWWGVAGCGASVPTTGPNHPFEFQGNTALLGIIGAGPPWNMGLMALVATDDDGPGTVNQLTRFGNYYPGSSVTRQEIIGGEVLAVLYFHDLVTGKIMRFDGTTLSEWWDPFTVLGTFYYWRLYVSGQEMLLLGDHTVGITASGTPDGPPAAFARGVIYYQPQPGALISLCTVVANYWNQDPGETGNRSIGFTGAARYRDNWYVTLDSSPGAMHSPSVAPYGQVITAPATGAALAFTEAYTPGYTNVADYTNVAKRDDGMWVGYPTVHKDNLYFFAVRTLEPVANGSCQALMRAGPSPTEFQVGRFDGSTWDPTHIDLGVNGGTNFADANAGWMFSDSEQLIIKFAQSPDEHIWFWRSAVSIDQFDITDTITATPIAGFTLGSHSVYFAIPDDDAVEEL